MSDPASPPPTPSTRGPIGDEPGLSFRQVAVRVTLIVAAVVIVFLLAMMVLGARWSG